MIIDVLSISYMTKLYTLDMRLNHKKMGWKLKIIAINSELRLYDRQAELTYTLSINFYVLQENEYNDYDTRLYKFN